MYSIGLSHPGTIVALSSLVATFRNFDRISTFIASDTAWARNEAGALRDMHVYKKT